MENIIRCRYHECLSENVTVQWYENKKQDGIKCHDCNKVTWPPKDPEDKIRRPASHRNLVKKKGVDHCQWCKCPEKLLPANQTLEGHHIVEYKDGGTDDVSNILVLCTWCHKDVHTKRTYIRHYIDHPKSLPNE